MKNENEVADILTLGQYRVGVTFNPGNSTLVDEIKRKSADLIDLCEKMKHTTHGMAEPEVLRLIAIAQTHYEESAHWAVKAATKPPF